MDASSNPDLEVLDIPEHEIPAYVSAKIAAKELSAIVQSLNGRVLSGAPVDKARGQAALVRLGFLT